MLADFWDWVADVFGRINDVSIYWLVFALALKTAESALIAVGWPNILRAAYPRSGLSFKTAWGASQAGMQSTPSLRRRREPPPCSGTSERASPGLPSPASRRPRSSSRFFTVVNVFMVLAVAIFRPRTVSKGSPSDEAGGFVTEHPFLTGLGAHAAVVVIVFIWRHLKPRLVSFWHKAKAGGAILRDWRRYLRDVALPCGASYCCRIGFNVVFMAAFSIPITALTVFLVASSHMLSGLFAITPGGVGQTQALDVATLRGQAPTEDIAAFSITQDAVSTVWTVVLGIAVMLWAFGYGAAKDLIFKRDKAAERPAVTP
ncbi:MAG: hypothetical protein ACRDQ2_15875 [Gaiellales bacterium]